MNTFCDDGKYREIENEEWSSEWVRVAYPEMLGLLVSAGEAFARSEAGLSLAKLSYPMRFAMVEFQTRRIAPNSKEYHAIWAALPDYEMNSDAFRFKAEVTRYMEEVAND